ncbi:hypothetical protein ABZX88_07775 [Kitasatospora aureofaciens]|uniref:hypothetical protein n=1 Tax=Kitasatospora aureofaciens TaxID=1894 RepID=UPI00052694F2|nr:hypothetical protein [Kitasatospora aureofaciens]HJD83997.1 hypothetical protein [Kitasatospora aureofaciens]
MATNQTISNGFQVNRSLLVGGVALAGIGSVLGAAGAALVCAALFSAGRSWVRGLETAPAVLAQRALREAKVASAAGWEAWRAEHGSAN